MTRRLPAPAAAFLSAVPWILLQAGLPAAPPEPMREFRGVWIATVHNVDWPSRSGLPADQQKAELIKILDRCVDLQLNAVVLQVRSECDALYESAIEPWSPWLTGTMGKSPGYDPLQFAIGEAHRRGIELHAWFNPFRAVNSKHGRISKNHVTKTHPAYTSAYGEKVWLDPAHPFVRERALQVIRDVLTRYDVDAIHLDDYFYPYPIKSGANYRDFNDWKSWTAYQKSGGKLSRADWRRGHINGFVKDLHILVRETKPSCKFGISPFGIYRPGYPVQVKTSLDSYNQIYTDVRHWLHEGWLDYIAPQLYWESSHPQYGFAGLHQWWKQENVQGRHVWPGIAIYRVKTEGRTALDPVEQVNICRAESDATNGSGHLLFSVRDLLANHSNVSGLLKSKVYTETALVPESGWLGEDASALPLLSPTFVRKPDGSLRAEWTASDTDRERVRFWLVQTGQGDTWTTLRPLPASETGLELPGTTERVSLRAVGRSGVLGATAFTEAPAG